MFDALEGLADLFKKSAPYLLAALVSIWICLLVMIQILASAVAGFPKLWADPPSVLTEQLPEIIEGPAEEIEDGCISIEDVLVCDDVEAG